MADDSEWVETLGFEDPADLVLVNGPYELTDGTWMTDDGADVQRVVYLRFATVISAVDLEPTTLRSVVFQFPQFDKFVDDLVELREQMRQA